MPSYIVNASTSVVLVDTSILGANQSTIVFLSAATTPGQVVTVRDSLGYLSSPQSILVSTTAGVQFADGTSSLRFTTPYAAASFSAADTSNWNIINTFGFPLNNTVANVKSLTASTLVGQSINIGGGLSTASVAANTVTAQSTVTVGGALAANRIYVGATAPPPVLSSGAVLVDGVATVTGNLTAGGALAVGGTATVSGNATIGGNASVAGAFTTLGSASITGNVTTVGAGTFGVSSLTVASTATILGAATFNSNVTVNSSVTVAQSTITSNLTTSTVVVNTGANGYIQLGTAGGPNLRARTDVIAGQTVAAWSAPLYAPQVSTSVAQASTATIGFLNVTGQISAPTVSQVLFGSAQIVNPNGNITVSSIAANSLTLSNTFTVQTLQTSTVQASSIQTQTLTTIGFVSAATTTAATISSGQISCGQVNAGIILTPAVQVSSLYVNRNIEGATNLSSVVIPNAVIDNSSGRFQTATLLANTLTTSTATITSGQITSPSTIRITASTVTLDNPYFSTFNASTFQTSSLTATRVTLGAPTTSLGPDFGYDSGAGVSTNVVVTGGPGNYLAPFFLSNVVPVGQNPATPYTTFISFAADYKGQAVPPGLLIEYSATLFWAGQVNSQLAIAGGPTLSGTSAANVSSISTLSQSTFGITATLYGGSAVSVNFKFRYTPNANSVDSNTVIQMNNGRLIWNYALNGTTIQNSLNDMTTRNLFYYGSLNFASDPRIKEDIQDADLTRCYQVLRDLPLRTYRYNTAYCSTFQVPATERIGVLATDVQDIFPHSVRPSETLMPTVAPDLLTVDAGQIQMAHLGATKYLMGEVERLERLLTVLEERAAPEALPRSA